MTVGTQPFQIKLSSLLIWGLGLFWMLAMLSADFRDPTFFNPLYPAEGLHNWPVVKSFRRIERIEKSWIPEVCGKHRQHPEQSQPPNQ